MPWYYIAAPSFFAGMIFCLIVIGIIDHYYWKD